MEQGFSTSAMADHFCPCSLFVGAKNTYDRSHTLKNRHNHKHHEQSQDIGDELAVGAGCTAQVGLEHEEQGNGLQEAVHHVDPEVFSGVEGVVQQYRGHNGRA